MQQPLTVIARLHARPDRITDLREALDALIEATRQEPGCINYDLHVSDDDPTLFVFHETWADRDTWEVHNASPHIHVFRTQAAELLDGEVQVDPLYRVD